MKKKRLTCNVFQCVLVSDCRLLFFLALLHNHCYWPFIEWSEGWSLWSGEVLDQLQQECHFFHRNSNPLQIFQLEPKRETSSSSLGDRLEKRSIIFPSNWAICARLWPLLRLPTNLHNLWQLALAWRVQALAFSQYKSLVDVSFLPWHPSCKC